MSKSTGSKMPAPRIGLIAFHLESNAFAPTATRTDFENRYYYVGGEMLARGPAARIAPEIPAFVGRMEATGGAIYCPILAMGSQSKGPADGAFIAESLRLVEEQLNRAMPIDAVYIANHGGMTATDNDDPDGDLYVLVREIVGPNVPVITTVDLHANISRRMVEAADAIISYRTNPHVDQALVACEAADLLRTLLGGRRLQRAALRLPIAPPTVRLLTKGNGTYASAMRRAEAMRIAPIASLSVIGGFVYSDTAKNGVTVLAYGDELEACRTAVRDIGQQIWDGRFDFEIALTSLDTAIASVLNTAAHPTLPAVCLADVGDNPGGGGSGNTTGILEALLAAGARGVLLGVFCDPEAAAACVAAAPGQVVSLVLNRNGGGDAKPLPVSARVMSLGHGPVIGRRGTVAGRTIFLGPSAAVQVAGVTLIISSNRVQCTDPAIFESFGLNIRQYRCVVIKSRGHFRAGFDEFFSDDRILEVDAPGITSPMLSRFPFKGLPRPIYPLDLDAVWSAELPLLV